MLQREKIQRYCGAFLTVCILVCIYAVMYTFGNVSVGSYPYNSYLIQAQTWLRGNVALEHDYPYLELAIYEGKYYVSFPPVPSVPMVLYTLIFGDNVPADLFQKVYLTITCLLVLSELERTKRMNHAHCIAWAIFLCIANAILPVALVGGVWYEAQVLALLFGTSAFIAMRRNHPTVSCLCYALSVGCRPFSAFFGPALLAIYIADCREQGISTKTYVKRLIPGLLVGIAVAACYGIYNYVRFDNPFEFGHNYLPEHMTSENGQFSLVYVAENFKNFFFGKAFWMEDRSIHWELFGFSMFISNPIYICGIVWIVQDILRRKFTVAKCVICVMGAGIVFCTLMHSTLGAYQFGARYALDFMPLCFAYYAVSPDRNEMRVWESPIFAFGLLLNIIGGICVHI